MRGIRGFSIPDRFVQDFVQVLRDFDCSHPGATLMTITDAPLTPARLGKAFADYPAIDFSYLRYDFK
jgi:hypothetical protein